MSHEWSSFQWSPPSLNNDGLIPVDFESFARVRPMRMPRPGGTSEGGGSGVYVSGDPNVPDQYEYNVKLVFQGTWAADLKNAFILAAETVSDLILGDIPAAVTRRSSTDDIQITAQLNYIDGVGGILGQAGPSLLRAGSFLPATGSMQFDSADAASYQAQGLFDDIVLHEMLHTLGFGTIWGNLGLITGTGFNGPLANAAYPGTALVPIELDGGAGTAWSHWDEETMYNELMTGYIDNDNYLSYVTVASLGDLGYSVVSGASYVQPWYI